jgi:hypothetical protein
LQDSCKKIVVTKNDKEKGEMYSKARKLDNRIKEENAKLNKKNNIETFLIVHTFNVQELRWIMADKKYRRLDRVILKKY